ncbi:MAG: hypothetical protein R2787_14540 [Saprospiraceae bacterium]
MKPMLRNLLAVLAGDRQCGQYGPDHDRRVRHSPTGRGRRDQHGRPESLPAFVRDQAFSVSLPCSCDGYTGRAYVAARISTDKKMMMALIIGAFFLMGGIMNVMSLPALPGSTRRIWFWPMYRWPGWDIFWADEADVAFRCRVRSMHD